MAKCDFCENPSTGYTSMQMYFYCTAHEEQAIKMCSANIDKWEAEVREQEFEHPAEDGKVWK